MKQSFKIVSKAFQHLIDGVYVNSKHLDRMQKMTQLDPDTRVIFLPVYRSFLDPFLIFYVNMIQGLEHGFIFNNSKDTPTAKFVIQNLKSIGSILMRTDQPGNHITQSNDKNVSEYVNQMYFQEAVKNCRFTTLFHNSKRNTVGKFNLKHLPDYTIRMLLSALEDLKFNGIKVKIVPVSINYDRIIEGAYMTNETEGRDLMDNDKVHTFFQKIKALPQGKLGKVIVKYLEPVDLNQYV